MCQDQEEMVWETATEAKEQSKNHKYGCLKENRRQAELGESSCSTFL